MATIATHNGSAAHRDHNIRNPKVVGKEDHIDLSLPHEIWKDEAPGKAYQRLFGKALKEYNEKQDRPERRIRSYYAQVEQDVKKHAVYEMIVGVYGDDVPEKTKTEIIKAFYDGWEQRNPNLALIGAYWHADEPGEQHLHLDYIPIGHGYTRGLETQNGLVRALEEMGFTKKGKETAQIQWERRENKYLEELCIERGITVEHPRDNEKKHLETALYKARQDLDKTVDAYLVVEDEKKALERKYEVLEGKYKAMAEEVKALKGERKQQKDIQKQIAGKTIFGKPRKKVELPYEEYQTQHRYATKTKNLEEREAELDAWEEKNRQKEKFLEQRTRETLDRDVESQKLHHKAREDAAAAKKLRDDAERYIVTVAEGLVKDALKDRDKDKLTEDWLKNKMLHDGSNAYDAYKQHIQFVQQKAVKKIRSHEWER